MQETDFIDISSFHNHYSKYEWNNREHIQEPLVTSDNIVHLKYNLPLNENVRLNIETTSSQLHKKTWK